MHKIGCGYVGWNVILEPIMHMMHAQKDMVVWESCEWNVIFDPIIYAWEVHNACMKGRGYIGIKWVE